MKDVQNNERVWVTLQEASSITGKSTSALRRLIHRNVIKDVRKERVKNGHQWLIHLEELSLPVRNEQVNSWGVQCERVHEQVASVQGVQVNAIPLEYFDGKLKEWERERSQLEQGLLMYRYKFEEQERQLRLLPAPAEVLTAQLLETEEALKAEVDYREQLINALHEKEARLIHLQAELEAEKKRDWWKKLMGVK